VFLISPSVANSWFTRWYLGCILEPSFQQSFFIVDLRWQLQLHKVRLIVLRSMRELLMSQHLLYSARLLISVNNGLSNNLRISTCPPRQWADFPSSFEWRKIGTICLAHTKFLVCPTATLFWIWGILKMHQPHWHSETPFSWNIQNLWNKWGVSCNNCLPGWPRFS
jgi:hypothetical protein